MKLTAKQNVKNTLADLYRSIDRQHAVTLTFDKEEKDDNGKKTGRLVEDVRTVEPYDIQTTLAGHIVIKAMDRQTGESRTIRLDRVHAYTLHRIPFIIEVPEATTPAGRPTVVRSAAQVIARELGRDYLPAARRITQTDTRLAA
jgi:predicted DNA-binding transcriptional regulator YafY